MTRIELFQSLKRSELLRNTSILISGTALAQLIPILLQPILRRYYSPDIFGAYAVYLSLVGILAIISSFKYELAIILPRKNSEAANIFFLTILINIIFNILLVFIILIWKTKILHFFNLSEKFSDYLYFVPLGIFFYSFYQSINYWLIRKKGFFPISVNKFVRRGFEGCAQLIFKFAKNSHGIIFGDLVGHFANIISGIYQGRKRGLSLGLLSPGKIKYVALKYSEFPRFNVIPSFMSACSFLLPVILINKFFSSEITGFFDLSKLLLSIPLALISTSISNVLLQSISEKFKIDKSLKKDLLLILGIVSVIATVEIIVITFFGVELFKLIFGELCGFSGRISQILVWSYALNFFAASFSAIFISMNKIKLLSIWQLFYFFSILSLTLFRNYEFLDFLKIYVSIEVFCYLIIIILMIYIVLGYEKRLKTQV
ncbi:MAG: oligosaccharide flippase family protein [Bacteroidia bacterium]|nr:oligosaccharide flippase family protein [Bacteroidia bacterium]